MATRKKSKHLQSVLRIQFCSNGLQAGTGFENARKSGYWEPYFIDLYLVLFQTLSRLSSCFAP